MPCVGQISKKKTTEDKALWFLLRAKSGQARVITDDYLTKRPARPGRVKIGTASKATWILIAGIILIAPMTIASMTFFSD